MLEHFVCLLHHTALLASNSYKCINIPNPGFMYELNNSLPEKCTKVKQERSIIAVTLYVCFQWI